ncbi:MAG: hypothetical protein COB38_06315 [Gammaproteobacteria bacterium]|nr:MAG: hypothetical protein COB38_06315 [Gammaproteobacteria bacterium]
MSLDVTELSLKMFDAFKGELSENWSDVSDYAEGESKKLAENFVMIEKLRLSEKITKEQAKLHHEIQRNASRSVLLTIEGLGLLAVEQAINAAINVLKDSVNGALDFALI